jgi:holo-[acyl-carrier protein] synthase
MIKGIGIDIIDIARIERTARNKLFYTRNYTSDEIAMFEARKLRPDVAAGNFAAKEAVLKALGCGIFDMPLTDIEVLRSPSGSPYVKLYGKAKQKADELGITNVHISISHTAELAAAEAIAEGD